MWNRLVLQAGEVMAWLLKPSEFTELREADDALLMLSGATEKRCRSCSSLLSENLAWQHHDLCYYCWVGWVNGGDNPVNSSSSGKQTR